MSMLERSMSYSVATTITSGSETQTAALVTKATHQATVAAKSILMSGGTESTALSTANAAAMSVLCPKTRGFHPSLSRRKAKRHAEVVSSIALMSAINAVNSTPRDLPPNVEFQTEPIKTDEQHFQREPDETPPQKPPPKPPQKPPPKPEPPRSDEDNQQNKVSAAGFGAAVMSLVGSGVASAQPKQEQETEPEPEPKNAESERALPPIDDTSLPGIEEGKESYAQDTDLDRYASLSKTPSPQVLGALPETETPKKLRRPYFGRKKDTRKKEMSSSSLKSEQSKSETDDLAAEIPLTDPIYTSKSGGSKAESKSKSERDGSGEEAPQGHAQEKPEASSRLSRSVMHHLSDHEDSYSTATSEDDDDDDDDDDEEENDSILEDEDTHATSFDSEPFATPANGFMTQSVDPFLASLTNVFACGPSSPSKQPTVEAVDSGMEDDRDEVEERDEISNKYVRSRESKQCFSLFGRNGESLSTVDSEDLLRRLNTLSSEAEAEERQSRQSGPRPEPRPEPRQEPRPAPRPAPAPVPRPAPAPAPSVQDSNPPKATLEDLVHRSLSGSTSKATRITVVSKNSHVSSEGHTSQVRSRSTAEETSITETRELAAPDEPSDVPSEERLEEPDLSQREASSNDAIAEFRFKSDPELDATSSKKSRGIKKLFGRRKSKK